MKHVLGIVWFVTFASLIWSISPLVAIGANAVFRPGYQVRDFASEYRARFMGIRVRWYDYRVYRMDCTPQAERDVVLLHTAEFTETPVEFLTRRFPECSNFKRQKSRVPAMFSGILLGRW